ncbi:DUF3566 domain-containing protein [Streptomyces sp. NPDC004533]|uniref:DUF3566 domain-containing protein n=1 Tax=Streptomyces sp. NPDC004533 TaxID=3154278 RepID=UPI0033B5F7A9
MSQGKRPTNSGRRKTAGSGASDADRGRQRERNRRRDSTRAAGGRTGDRPPTAENARRGQPGEDAAPPHALPAAQRPTPVTTAPQHPPRPASDRLATDGPPGRPERQGPQDRQASPATGGTDGEAAEAGEAPGRSGERRRRWPPVTGRGPRWRRVRLRISAAEPWSVMKTSFLVSAGLGLCVIVMVGVVAIMLTVLGQEPVVSLGWETTVGLTIVVVTAEVGLVTALATLVAFLFNWTSGAVGGVEMTLAEEPPAPPETESDAAPDEDGLGPRP